MYRLRLYVTGLSPTSQRAIDYLFEIVRTQLDERFDVEIIDVLENPVLAEDEKILATPTLVKQLPEPVRKIIGDLSDRDRVLLGLDLIPLQGGR